MKINLLQTVS